MYLPGQLDWRVLVACGAVCLCTTLLLGLVPALETSKVDVAAALKTEMAGVVGGGHGKAWARATLVLVQVSLSFLLLVGTGLVVKSLERIRSSSPGFSTRNVFETFVDLRAGSYDVARAKSFQDELLVRVRALPGVQSAALGRLSPLGYRSYSSNPVSVDGYVPAPEEDRTVEYNEVGPDYFTTMGIPLVTGRQFTAYDDENAAPVAIVNETMAAKFWPAVNPVGQRLQLKQRWLVVVGVAKDSKYQSVREAPKPFFYVPLRQNFAISAVLHIRSEADPNTLGAEVAREVHALDADLAPYELISMQEQVARATAAQQAAVTLLAVLGGLALLLAAIGLYAVMSYSVSQRTRELGLRMALGAGEYDLLTMVMRRGMALTAAGVALGAAVGLGGTRLLGNLIFGVSPRDPMIFGLAFLVMGVAAAVACLLPAWRATHCDPLHALRAQ